MHKLLSKEEQHDAARADGLQFQTNSSLAVEASSVFDRTYKVTKPSLQSYLEFESINDSFPFKLHLMLSELEEQNLCKVVAWQPHGRSFVVHNRKEFVKDIMPTFFRMSKFESFQRQLNIYGFNRMTTGLDKGGYYHESFVRGRRDLCYFIQRRKVKGTFVRKPAAPEKEPNFYKIPIAPPQNVTETPLMMPGLATTTDLATIVGQSMGSAFDNVTSYETGASGRSLAQVESSQPTALDMIPKFDNVDPAATLPLTRCAERLNDHHDETSAKLSQSCHSHPAPLVAEQFLFEQNQIPQQLIVDDFDTCFEALLAALRRT